MSGSQIIEIIGVISDTHGWLRAKAVHALDGVKMIVHAGDIGDESVLDELGMMAPVYAVRGNVDCDPWTAKLPRELVVETKHANIAIVHDVGSLRLDVVECGVSVIVHGHTHRAECQMVDGILRVNPGSAGQSRGGSVASVALLYLGEPAPWAEIIDVGD